MDVYLQQASNILPALFLTGRSRLLSSTKSQAIMNVANGPTKQNHPN